MGPTAPTRILNANQGFRRQIIWLCTFGDFNGDFRIDTVSRWINHEAARFDTGIYFNTLPTAQRNAFQIEVIGKGGKTNQYGRVVRVTSANSPQEIYTRVVDGGSGLLSQNQYPLIFHSKSSGMHRGEVLFASGPVKFNVWPGQKLKVYEDDEDLHF